MINSVLYEAPNILWDGNGEPINTVGDGHHYIALDVLSKPRCFHEKQARNLKSLRYKFKLNCIKCAHKIVHLFP